MQKLAIILAIAACGGSHKSSSGPANAPAADLSVTRWVPAHPTYMFAAPKLRDAQAAVRSTLDSVGMLANLDSASASQLLENMIAIDPLNESPATSVGIDLDGGFTMFSEDVEPTFVFHLTAPDLLQQFFDKQRQRGMVTQSVVSDGIEVFTTKVGGDLNASWAIDKDWMWLHFGKAGNWFEHSHKAVAAAGAWAADWAWAKAKHSGALTGFVKVHDIVDKLGIRGKNAAACVALLSPIGRLSVSADANLGGASGRIAIDLGASAKEVASHALPPPPGWAALAGTAALSVQVNLDLAAVTQWLSPCLYTFGIETGELEQYGVRSARAALLSLDPDEPSGTGVVALDLTQKTALDQQLDQIPMRSHLERSKQFGAHKGHRVAIPFVATFDYVLEDHLAIAAMGDGVLDQVVAGSAPAGPPPLFALDLAPSKLSDKAWMWLATKAGMSVNRRFIERFQKWHDGHISISIDGDALVLDAAGHLR